MKHVPTTATTVRKIKAAAKIIRDQQHIALAAALDLAAQAAGYANFHHVTTCAAHTAAQTRAPSSGLGQLRFVISDDSQEWRTYTYDGDEKGIVKQIAGWFDPGHSAASIKAVSDRLDEVTRDVGSVTGDMAEIGFAGLNKIIASCRQLTGKEPAFLDGYAHWAGALVALNQSPEAVVVARPVYDMACALIPGAFNGFIPYSDLDNRPFHRLAVNLLLAHKKINQIDEATAIARCMLKWWPNDNIGFRFL